MQNLSTELKNLTPIQLDAGLIFSGNTSNNMIEGFTSPCSYTPTIDNNYIFHDSSRDIIVWFLHKSDPLYVYGPTGCGKSSLLKQIAARLNYPVFEITGHGRLEFADLIGHLAVKDSNMIYEYGSLSLAMKYGGLFLFNEIDLTSPEVAAGLNGILDGAPLCISENGGELIHPHPMFRFVATANTNAGGDETGLYQGTLRQNLAFADRFILCKINYPAPEVEKTLLGKLFPILPEDLICKMVDYANEIRRLFMGETDGYIEITLSTRTLVRWADLTVKYQALASQNIHPINYALDRALGFRASRETRAMLHELSQRIFAYEDYPQKPRPKNPSAHFTMASLSQLDPKSTPSLYLTKNYLTSSNNSSTKFWNGEVDATGLNLKWGKVNTKGSQRFIPINNCINSNPIQELSARASQKLSRGYVIDQTKSTI